MRKLRYERPDVAVVDLMLPGVDGWRITETLRSEGIETPIVIVSARGSEHDKVHALQIGRRRLPGQAVRHARAGGPGGGGAAPSGHVARGGPRRRRSRLAGLAIDPDLHAALLDGADAGLTPTEFRLLYVLASEQGRALTRDQLQQRVWGMPHRHRDRTVDVCVRKLREKLDRRSAVAHLHPDPLRRRLPLRPGREDLADRLRPPGRRRGQDHPHGGAAPLGALDLRPAAVGLGDVLDDREAQPGARARCATPRRGRTARTRAAGARGRSPAPCRRPAPRPRRSGRAPSPARRRPSPACRIAFSVRLSSMASTSGGAMAATSPRGASPDRVTLAAFGALGRALHAAATASVTSVLSPPPACSPVSSLTSSTISSISRRMPSISSRMPSSARCARPRRAAGRACPPAPASGPAAFAARATRPPRTGCGRRGSRPRRRPPPAPPRSRGRPGSHSAQVRREAAALGLVDGHLGRSRRPSGQHVADRRRQLRPAGGGPPVRMPGRSLRAAAFARTRQPEPSNSSTG